MSISYCIWLNHGKGSVLNHLKNFLQKYCFFYDNNNKTYEMFLKMHFKGIGREASICDHFHDQFSFSSIKL